MQAWLFGLINGLKNGNPFVNLHDFCLLSLLKNVNARLTKKKTVGRDCYP